MDSGSSEVWLHEACTQQQRRQHRVVDGGGAVSVNRVFWLVEQLYYKCSMSTCLSLIGV